MKHEFEHDAKLDVGARARKGVNAVPKVFEEMPQHLEADYRELPPTGRGELRATTTATS